MGRIVAPSSRNDAAMASGLLVNSLRKASTRLSSFCRLPRSTTLTATRHIGVERVAAFVGTLVRHRLAVRDGDRALALALPEAEHQAWLEEREGRSGEPHGFEISRIGSSDVRPGHLAHA